MPVLTIGRATDSREFHEDHAPDAKRIVRWRRNGQTRRWKRDLTRFEVPVKFGLYAYGTIRNDTGGFHAIEDCPSYQLGLGLRDRTQLG